MYAKSAATAKLTSSRVRVPSENCELAQSSRDATLSHPDSTPPKAPQMLTSSLWDHKSLNAPGRPCANSCSAASSFAMKSVHSESASGPRAESLCAEDLFTIETMFKVDQAYQVRD